MRKKLGALLGALMLSASVTLTIPQAQAETATPKEVKVCPMMDAKVKGEGSGNQVVGEHKVYFCCGGCKGAFNKLSKEEQAKRVADAVKKQDENK